MPLSDFETRKLLAGRVRARRAVHRPYRRFRLPRVVCAHCVAPWPCHEELWVRAVLRQAP